MIRSLPLPALFIDNKAVSRKDDYSTKRNKARKKTKPQASKKQVHEAIELQWLQQFLTVKTAAVLFFIALLLSVPYILPAEQILPIDKIKVSGDYRQINMTKINQQLDSFLGKGFFSVNIQSLQQDISKQPWIKSVSVKRVWPNQLQVDITKKQAVARWDDEHLLSQQAVIFKADIKKFSNLPLISGYAGQSTELLKRYRVFSNKFSEQGILVSELIEDNKGALTLMLNKTLKVNIGSENNEMKIDHLLAIYPDYIKPRVDQIKYIDFRYNNGFSIAWKDEFINKSDDKKQRGNKNV